jgi:hypothetical protein
MNRKIDSTTASTIFKYLGFESTPNGTLNDISKLFKSWCNKIGFDTFYKALYPEDISCLDPNIFFKHALDDKISNTCYPGAIAFASLLDHIPNVTYKQVVGKWDTAEGASDVDPFHPSIIVNVEGAPYLIDLGIQTGELLNLSSVPTRTTSTHIPMWSDVQGVIEYKILNERLTYRFTWEGWNEESDNLYSKYIKNTEPLTARRLIGDISYLAIKKSDSTAIIKLPLYGKPEINRVSDEEFKEFIINTLGYSEKIANQVMALDIKNYSEGPFG